MGAPVALLFALVCPDPCGVPPLLLAELEQAALLELTKKGWEVRPAPAEAVRPTGATATPEPIDVSAQFGVDRVVVLDLEADQKTLWVTHFLRGTPGAWAVGKSTCGPGPKGEVWICPNLSDAVVSGLRPRRALDVDFTAALRAHSRIVGDCVAEEDEVPALERVYGRVDMELEARPNGEVRVKSIAPASVARSRLGACLRKGMERMWVGPFEGKPVKLRVPLDL
ncbi:MAG: hypothetical protein IPG45_34770 [Deltaproteobacteria bacterium]|nr:hypothetical protein [Deltaproteobacteria bacterium]